jgi:very-short-patch-repair endonuclease
MKVLMLFLIVLALLAVAPVLLKNLFGVRPTSNDLPYKRRGYLLSVAERSFYEVLCGVLDNQLHVFPKVRLWDLVYLPKGTKNWMTHKNRVQSKHVDFVLCDRQSIAPVLVIELDDASHEREDRKERDAFLDKALAAASLPILHIATKRSYAPKELAELIQQKLQ